MRKAVEVIRRQKVQFVFILLIAASFGPYITGGLRTEQIAVYGLAVLAVFLAPNKWMRATLPRLTVSLTVTWGMYILIAIIGVLAPLSGNQFRWESNSIFAGVDNLMLPLATLLLIVVLVDQSNQGSVIRSVCLTTVFCTLINAVIAIVMTGVDLSSYLRRWWSPAGDFITVAENAATLGRVSGIFNQPAEAGLMYGIAGLAAIYLWSDNARILYPTIALVSIGGILCVSKIFVLVAAPIIIWQIWRARRGKVGGLLGIVLIAVIALQAGLFSQWTGLSYLSRLLSPGQDSYMSFYTAGRLGSSSSLTDVVSEVIRVSPLIGVGAGGLQVPYDNGWVEALVMAGILGVVAYTLALWHFGAIAAGLTGKDAKLAWGLTWIALIGSIGAPALTANRAGTVLWILIGTLSVVAVKNHREMAYNHSQNQFTEETPLEHR